MDLREPVDIEIEPPEQSMLGQLLHLVGIDIQDKAGLGGMKLPASALQLLGTLPPSLLLAPSTPQARLDMQIEVR
jgi:hypothetical protein